MNVEATAPKQQVGKILDEDGQDMSTRVVGRPFPKGVSGNPNGRPKGSLNWNTIFKKAIKKIVKNQKLPVKDVEVELVITGIMNAFRGNYPFWRDIMDRNFGSTNKAGDTNIDKAIIVQPILGGRSITRCPKCGEELIN